MQQILVIFMKVLILVCGEGLGHTARCIAMGRAFERAGDEVHFGAYGYSKDLIERKGFSATYIPPEITLVGNSGTLDLLKSTFYTIKNFDPFLFFRFLKLVKKEKPDIVISDSYFTVLFVAKLKSCPSYLVLNQSNMEEFFLDKGIFGVFVGKIAKLVYLFIYNLVDGIIVPDFPMPYTICQKNLYFSEKISKKVYYSGPLVGANYNDVTPANVSKPHVLSTLGGFGYRKNIFFKVIESAKMNPDINYTLLSGPGVAPSEFKDIPKNVTVLDFIDDQFPYIKSSDALIIPGGHSTIMESLSFGVPILSFPDTDHNEQQKNASVVEESDLGFNLDYSTTPEFILKCLNEIIYDGKFKENTQKMKSMAKSLNGPDNIVNYLKSMTENKLKNKSNNDKDPKNKNI